MASRESLSTIDFPSLESASKVNQASSLQLSWFGFVSLFPTVIIHLAASAVNDVGISEV